MLTIMIPPSRKKNRGDKLLGCLILLAACVWIPSIASAQQMLNPTFEVHTYASNVPNPFILSFEPSGILYVGQDTSLLTATVHQVFPNGAVVPYGPDWVDPDGVLFAPSGFQLAPPGSLLVANGLLNGTGRIDTILPDQSTINLLSMSMSNPTDMVLDGSGRLLIANFIDTTQTGNVLVSTGGTPTVLFSLPARPLSIELDRNENIFTATFDDGVIRIHASDGAIINGNLIPGGFTPGFHIPIGFGPLDPTWKGCLYVLDNMSDRLFRINLPSNLGDPASASVIGIGFGGLYLDLEFGPDGSLYLSDAVNDLILRVRPRLRARR